MNKPERRSRLAALSFSEKVRIPEKLRGRGHAIAAAGVRLAQRLLQLDVNRGFVSAGRHTEE